MSCPRCDIAAPHLHVTDVLADVGLTHYEWADETARTRGDYVHRMTEYFDRGELDTETLDPALVGYLSAYQRFHADVRPVWTHIEHRVHDEVYGYAGRLDRAGSWVGVDRAVLDIKSGPPSPATAIQLAAYRRCLPEPHTWRRFALQLSDDGSYHLHTE
jgi:hypothetical protein